jgi:hypothetical protein
MSEFERGEVMILTLYLKTWLFSKRLLLLNKKIQVDLSGKRASGAEINHSHHLVNSNKVWRVSLKFKGGV